jgi:hypothetical protein
VTCADIIVLGGREAVSQVNEAPPLPVLNTVWLERQGPKVVDEMKAVLEEAPARNLSGHCHAKGEGRPSSKRNKVNTNQPVTSNVWYVR